MQRKLEQLEMLKPRLKDDLYKIDEALRPLPPIVIEAAPEPQPIRVRVIQPPPQPQEPIVIEMPAPGVMVAGGATAHATGGTAYAVGGSAGFLPAGGDDSVQGLARKALDSVKRAGGSQGLEEQIGSVAKAALGIPETSGYEKAGGSGAQASIQTGSSLKSSTSNDDIPSLARRALDNLGSGESTGSSS